MNPLKGTLNIADPYKTSYSEGRSLYTVNPRIAKEQGKKAQKQKEAQ
jgi:hypothetical protein